MAKNCFRDIVRQFVEKHRLHWNSYRAIIVKATAAGEAGLTGDDSDNSAITLFNITLVTRTAAVICLNFPTREFGYLCIRDISPGIDVLDIVFLQG